MWKGNNGKMIEVKSKASRVSIPVSRAVFSDSAISLYDIFNKEVFDDTVSVQDGFQKFVELVYSGFSFQPPTMNTVPVKFPENVPDVDPNMVLVAVSGGLDSIAQMLFLKESGRSIVAYTMANMNRSCGGQELKAMKAVCEKVGVPIVEARYVGNFKKDNPYRKHWAENPIKNQMIMATMVDWCIENGCRTISLGEKDNFFLKDCVPGTNFTDASEVSRTFIECVNRHVGIDYLTMDLSITKLDELKIAMKYGVEDLLFSCFSAQSSNKCHEMNQRKYGITLWRNNCGCSCRKCAHYNLLLHYGGIKAFPQDFVDACWRKLYSTKELKNTFNPSMDEKTRMENLFNFSA